MELVMSPRKAENFMFENLEKEGRGGNGKKNEAANPTAGEARGAGGMTQLPTPRPTAPFGDSNRFSFLLPEVLGQALES